MNQKLGMPCVGVSLATCCLERLCGRAQPEDQPHGRGDDRLCIGLIPAVLVNAGAFVVMRRWPQQPVVSQQAQPEDSGRRWLAKEALQPSRMNSSPTRRQ